MNKITVAVACAVAVAFLIMSCWLLSLYGSKWEQAVVIYNAVCSVAFSAFGVLLGSKVQEVNVVKSAQATTEAQKAAEAARSDAQKKADAIKQAVKTLANGVIDKEAGGGTGEAISILANANRSAHETLSNAL